MPAQQVHFIINRSSRYRLLHILANVLTALLPVFADHGKCDGADGQLAGEELQDRSKIRRSRAIVSSELLAAFQLKESSATPHDSLVASSRSSISYWKDATTLRLPGN